jgi:alanyl-tRNA synthetase
VVGGSPVVRRYKIATLQVGLAMTEHWHFFHFLKAMDINLIEILTMEVNQIRTSFLDFFKKNGHNIVHSSPLVPHNDPTLMFTTAGMVQFKNYFTGAEKPAYKTAASSQKCVRAGGKHNDLENVGYTARHHTFFEMLGNFSFGDYFKERAIELAWNCLTKEFKLPKDKLYVTVYHTDDEAYKIWHKITGFGDDRIIRISSNDNFWAMGDTGPCGPCSEIFYDHGPALSGGLPGAPDEGGDRFVEIWNLVFMQFEDVAGGQRLNLPNPSIDTGMGLERLAAVLQGKHNNFEIDLFQNIIDASQHLSGNNEHLTSHRVIADHIRAGSFLIADGVMPSNEGRGYVLRRIMRRAMRHVHILGCKDPLLYRLVPTLVTEMGDAFPELRRAEPVISSILQLEEERFRETLEKGLKLLNESSPNLKAGDVLDGAIAFKLYDTFGFPLDLTLDILRAREIGVDQKGFDEQMRQQKERAKAAWVGSGDKVTEALWFEIHTEVGASEFLGYTSNQGEAVVQAIIVDGKCVEKAASGSAIVILNQTPFYAESGGQIGDTGLIGVHKVVDTHKYAGSLFGHHTELAGELKVGDVVLAKIDVERRTKIRANHSATHLLHKALRETLGLHVTQKGSLVAPDRLRFDFSQPKALTLEEIRTIENRVNEMILANTSAGTEVMTPDMAISKGAMALFGEKYGDEVRVVSMAESIELCGGTHVCATGDIGLFKIISEEAIASGVRRIEAITGMVALEYANTKELALKNIANALKCAEADILTRITNMAEDKRKLEKDIAALRIKQALTAQPMRETIANVELIMQKVDGIPPQDLKAVVDILKNGTTSGVIVVTSIFEGKVSLMVHVSQDLLSKFKAGDLAREAATELKGNGGGRPDFAQAGGTDISGIDRALDKVRSTIAGVKG